MQDQARNLADGGRLYEAIDLIERYLLVELVDASALFLLSDLYQMTGQAEKSLDPLFAILLSPATPEVARRARQRVDLLVNAREQELINVGDVAGLVRYFQGLVGFEPGYDGHRLKLVRWLMRSGDLVDAAQLLKEVGNVGVTDDELTAIRLELQIAQTSLPVERIGGALYTSASVRGTREESLRLLIDTGATMTGLSLTRLKEVGARRLDKVVQVHTANGMARMEVYQINELRLGSIVLEDMEVLAFQALPGNADGLLGMDVLDKLPKPVPKSVGRP